MARHSLPGENVGRHRYGRGDRVHCREIPVVREYFSVRGSAPRWLRFLSVRRSRHSFAWFSKQGTAALPAFALITSL